VIPPSNGSKFLNCHHYNYRPAQPLSRQQSVRSLPGSQSLTFNLPHVAVTNVNFLLRLVLKDREFIVICLFDAPFKFVAVQHVDIDMRLSIGHALANFGLNPCGVCPRRFVLARLRPSEKVRARSSRASAKDFIFIISVSR
jgi:hypothetical protein